MDLCLALGCTLGELDERMTAAEFSLWFIKWQRAPWADRRADIHVGLLRETIVSWAGRSLKAGARISLEEFIPFRPRPVVDEVDPLTHFRELGA